MNLCSPRSAQNRNPLQKGGGAPPPTSTILFGLGPLWILIARNNLLIYLFTSIFFITIAYMFMSICIENAMVISAAFLAQHGETHDTLQ